MDTTLINKLIKSLIGTGKSAGRRLSRCYSHDQDCINEFFKNIHDQDLFLSVDEREKEYKKSLKQTLDDAAADCFYDKSIHEYRILQENFNPVSKLLKLDGRSGVFPCHQYMMKHHYERNKVFTNLCLPRRDKVLCDIERQNPCVTVDIAGYLAYLCGYATVKKCIEDRRREKLLNKKLARETFIHLTTKNKYKNKELQQLFTFLEKLSPSHEPQNIGPNISQHCNKSENSNEQTNKQSTKAHHELVRFMDSATMYSRAKEARQFHHNFVCFSWIGLGLPLDWLALVPAALMEGDDSLKNLDSHSRGKLREQFKALSSREGLALGNGDVARMVLEIGDGKEIREGTAHTPGKHWHKVCEYVSM